MNNVSTIRDCYGCGVCAIACGRKLIRIEEDKDGFYAPRIDEIERCTDCGLCSKVCAYQHKDVVDCNHDPQAFAAWSLDEDIRNSCSSGGVGFEIAKQGIERGYKFCGCRYNPHMNRAEHYIATTEAEWKASMGSKYIQSYTAEAFGRLNRKEKCLVTGTPCQIDSLRRYLRLFNAEERFVFLDFFCHGVPSKLIWDKYLASVEQHLGPVSSVTWRDKEQGWHDSWVMVLSAHTIGGEQSYHSRSSQGDAFYQLFLGNQCLGKACYHHCKYKHLNSAADIRIGDLWGKTYESDEKGVSALVAMTARGRQIIAETTTIQCVAHENDVVTEGQMKHHLSYPTLMRPIQLFLAKTHVPIKWQAFVSRYVNKLKNKLSIP